MSDFLKNFYKVVAERGDLPFIDEAAITDRNEEIAKIIASCTPSEREKLDNFLIALTNHSYAYIMAMDIDENEAWQPKFLKHQNLCGWCYRGCLDHGVEIYKDERVEVPCDDCGDTETEVFDCVVVSIS